MSRLNVFRKYANITVEFIVGWGNSNISEVFGEVGHA
jgi:hypothetical protein